MCYQVKEIDFWGVNVTLRRGDDVICGGEVKKRYLPQWSHTGAVWYTYTNLGLSPNGFETPESADRLLPRKNPRYKESFDGISKRANL